MILVLFYMEDLRNSIIDSLRASDTIDDEVKTKKKCDRKIDKFKAARLRLESEGVISKKESQEIKELIDFRNTIGHRIYEITADIGPYSNLSLYVGKQTRESTIYKYDAVSFARNLREKVLHSMGLKGYILSLGLASIAFYSAEKVYIKEIKSLRKKIYKKGANHERKIADLNEELKRLPQEVVNFVEPGHPNNFLANGNLSKKGIEGIYRLFDNKLTPLATAHLLRISYRAASRWYKRWSSDEGRSAGVSLEI
ncbi:hypothetical protein [Pantoea brenneri]|uniref:Uncharacterized protein n=2 Tax=Erwiniaceae TaxID=1903409 RepID=A0ABU9MR77_9GAMM|nr:hypothetical protein [Pantoea sp. 3.5.1]